MRTIYFYKCLTIFFLFLISCRLSLQAQVIQGSIKDAGTKQFIGFCNISVANSSTGIVANADGNFKITIPQNINSPKLIISAVGYVSDTLVIS